MNKKLIVTDVDGTLISRNFKILDSTKKELARLQRQGHAVAIASGRPTPGVMFYAKEIELDRFGGYVMSYNGGRVVNAATGEVVYLKTHHDHILVRAQKYALKHGLGVVAYRGDDIIAGSKENEYMKLEREACRVRSVYESDFSTLGNCSPKAIISCHPDVAKIHLPIISEMFGDEASVYMSEPFFIEIMPKGLDKSEAVKGLAERLNIDISDAVCFGDGYNDVTMLKAAGVGIAMENACDEAKAAADFVTRSCDDDGIAYAIENILKI